MLRASRGPTSQSAERWVYPKVFVFLIGGALGVIGMTAHIDWLVTVAVAVLAVGVAMRFLGRDPSTAEPEVEEHDDVTVDDQNDVADH